MEQQAKAYATHCHKGQKRKTGEKYIEHPGRIVAALKQYGVTNDVIFAIAWLHDVIEDANAPLEELQRFFGKDVAHGVFILTRNVDEEEYKRRLLDAAQEIQLIKIFDTIDNLQTLHVLHSSGIKRKIDDCFTYYVPLAREISPQIADQLLMYINDYYHIDHSSS